MSFDNGDFESISAIQRGAAALMDNINVNGNRAQNEPNDSRRRMRMSYGSSATKTIRTGIVFRAAGGLTWRPSVVLLRALLLIL